jgi:hypothetical protein
VPEQDKAAVRENIIESMARAPPIVRNQLGECLRSLVHADFPERWPGLLPTLLHNLASQARRALFLCGLDCVMESTRSRGSQSGKVVPASGTERAAWRERKMRA